MTHVDESPAEPARNTYDELPYPGGSFSQTHPNRLATIGTLFGMRPAAVRQCRVLELGCASGGNLIPMAISLPDSEFVGLDLSGRQVESGRDLIRSLDLGNIRLEHLNIADVDESCGSFDYIIAHGIFSWVPFDIQEKILSICSERLNPQGIAYISYNTYPGWHMRGMLRDMMLYHTRQFSDTQMRIDQARALVNFLSEAVPDRGSPYSLLIADELSNMRNWHDSYFFHDSLEVYNEPMYFHQFVERAGAHQLRYLGEAQFSAMLASEFSSGIAATLSEIGRDIIEMEQYMDFVRNRMFRQTLLCHAETPLNRTLTATCCEQFHVRSALHPADALVDLQSADEVEFRSARGALVTVSNPIQKAALLALAEVYPATIAFPELMSRARALTQREEHHVYDRETLAAQSEGVCEALFKCFCGDLVELEVHPTSLAAEASTHPRASSLAREQAEPEGHVTNLLHERVGLDALNAHLVRHLDGRRDRAELLQVLLKLATDGTIVATENGERIEDRDALAAVLEQQLDSRLHELARLGLLEE